MHESKSRIIYPVKHEVDDLYVSGSAGWENALPEGRTGTKAILVLLRELLRE